MIPKSILVFLFSCVMATAIAQKPVQVILPKTEFDIKQASEMLNEGNSEIKGVAYYEDRAPIGIKVGETIYARLGIVVTLYPVTAYMEEYLELKKKNRPNKRVAGISTLANCYRIETKIYGSQGEFVFKGLKPGKYYLESMVHFPSGSVAQEVSGIVEINKDGESVNFKLKHIF
ncbi:prealbumin-like fold domain-containing protein [Pseudobacter ginsenosidimutans]|uniref:Carboxypeptidase family protein n=1 Tax=Pseudobacter ginsenosidimutans TaxID=661488 RepID=A0A4V2F138_9BACT|nr:prealbumin-like fold domain-containing protein [Pseudobacter ginsenosidimutans]QEC40975.1 hypothetical protein FSB84_04430 [Pseudobacter ginsenosidimutans]RZS72281.1 hypothetical protein EV199_4197 [Pseudobacter ginsenosidimutans]